MTDCFIIIFFFSSRRRHTRCSRDWSSDVCSSDLPSGGSDIKVPILIGAVVALLAANIYLYTQLDRLRGDFGEFRKNMQRSEERRVGKECGSRWWWNNLKKNN